MNSSDSSQGIHGTTDATQDLDSLLDDALDDFNKPIISKKKEEISITDSRSNTSEWTDEFIKQATQNFESTMKNIIEHQNTSDQNKENDIHHDLDIGEMSVEFAKFAEVAAKTASEAETDKDFTKCLRDTMHQITKNKEEAQAIPSAEELERLFGQMGLSEEAGSGLGGLGEEMGGFFPLMQTMLENILSKEVLYHPIKDIVLKYPDWLADNRSKLEEEEFERYNKQYGVMKQVVEKFESESDNTSQEVKAQNFESILMLMQKLPEYGHPPQDLVGDQIPMMTFDEDGNPTLPDLSSLFGSLGFPQFGTTSKEEVLKTEENIDEAKNTTEEQCSIM